MAKIRLGVNIDHVATVRNARGETYPSPLKAALLSEKFGAESITIHLREDRRHINEKDLIQIKRKLTIPLNLEIACTKEMLRISLKQKPSFVCIVPEKRQEVTTEGGLNLRYKKKLLKHLIDTLKNNGTRISLFIEPSLKDIKIAKLLGTDCIEIHTGKFCNFVNKNISYKNELNRIKNAVKFANSIGLEVHAGHGLTYKSAQILSKVKGIVEFNIGHFIVGESIFYGLKHSINKFKRIIS
tara:strand:+ start:111 stop:833 length:723 start_codon:yes stop_codon:yes gene_type:complete